MTSGFKKNNKTLPAVKAEAKAKAEKPVVSEWLTRADVARMFTVSERTIANWYARGKLPLTRIKMNNIVRFRRVECEAWLAMHTTVPVLDEDLEL